MEILDHVEASPLYRAPQLVVRRDNVPTDVAAVIDDEVERAIFRSNRGEELAVRLVTLFERDTPTRDRLMVNIDA